MPDAQARPSLQGRRILVVEDEYLLADDLRSDLEGMGAEVLGPVPSVAAALEVLAAGPVPDAAVLDVNLGGEMVFPVADALSGRGVPFVFATGYEQWALPDDYAAIPRFEKPLDVARITDALTP